MCLIICIRLHDQDGILFDENPAGSYSHSMHDHVANTI